MNYLFEFILKFAKMVYSLEQRIFLVLEYHRLDHSITQTRRSFQKKFSIAKGPSRNTIISLFEKFEQTGSVNDDRAGNAG